MPRQLETFAFRRRGQSESQYDWATLLDGSIWECMPGDDFTIDPQGFQQTMYSGARRRGCRVHCTTQDSGSVVVQAYDWEEGCEFGPAQGSSETASSAA